MARRALDTFAHWPDGGRVPDTVVAGELYADDHDAVRRWPAKFEDPDLAIARREAQSGPVTATATPPPETTTAAPGERRSTSIPKGRRRGTKAKAEDTGDD